MQKLDLLSAIFVVTAVHLLCPVSQAAADHRDRAPRRPLVAEPGIVQATPGVPQSAHPAVAGKTLNGICHSASWDYEAAPCRLLEAADLNPRDRRIRHLAGSGEGSGKAQRTELTEWVERQRAKIEGLQQEARARESQARKALDRAQAAMQLADSAKDAEAKSIAAAAVRIASQTLARTQEILRRLGLRLQTITELERHAAGGATGSTSVVRGEVLRITGADFIPVGSGTPFAVGEELRTGPNGFAELVLTDGSLMHLGPDSRLALVQGGHAHSIYELITGRLHAEMQCLKQVGQPCRTIRMRMGVAVAVRGTEIDLAVVGDEVGITVIGGVVEITSADARTLTVQSGERAVMIRGGLIGQVSRVPGSGLKRWWED